MASSEDFKQVEAALDKAYDFAQGLLDTAFTYLDAALDRAKAAVDEDNEVPEPREFSVDEKAERIYKYRRDEGFNGDVWRQHIDGTSKIKNFDYIEQVWKHMPDKYKQ